LFNTIKYLQKLKFSYFKYIKHISFLVPVFLYNINNNYTLCDNNINNEKLLSKIKKNNTMNFNINQSNRKFGIELEFIGFKNIFDQLLDNLNKNLNYKQWIIIKDATPIDKIDNDIYGIFELISPILSDINKIDDKVLQLHTLFVDTNIKTGFHVHIDANDLTN